MNPHEHLYCECGYDLSGIGEVARCPECGKPCNAVEPLTSRRIWLIPGCLLGIAISRSGWIAGSFFRYEEDSGYAGSASDVFWSSLAITGLVVYALCASTLIFKAFKGVPVRLFAVAAALVWMLAAALANRAYSVPIEPYGPMSGAILAASTLAETALFTLVVIAISRLIQIRFGKLVASRVRDLGLIAALLMLAKLVALPSTFAPDAVWTEHRWLIGLSGLLYFLFLVAYTVFWITSVFYAVIPHKPRPE